MPEFSTPIWDFVHQYASGDTTRFHMPGHKGRGGPLERLDITEIQGADALYEADGIIAESEKNAGKLFGSGRTVYSTEGSSQCIRAMVYLLSAASCGGRAPRILAARNAHRSFLYAAALTGAEVTWLYSSGGPASLCACPVSAEAVKAALGGMEETPDAVYLTSPDYLGGMQDIAGIAAVCHERGILLLVDNAHGAYLKFLKESRHPLDLEADLVCDSAHKTLPVLTGGAYLHAAAHTPAALRERMKEAMAVFGSTSPSYLTLSSLDRFCADTGYRRKIPETAEAVQALKQALTEIGWTVIPSDPLRITIEAPAGSTGTALAAQLRKHSIEPEFADRDFLVLMVSPNNTAEDIARLRQALVEKPDGGQRSFPPPLPRGEKLLSIREAVFSPAETIPVEDAAGRICALPLAACPPAVAPFMPGERIPADTAALRAWGIDEVSVVK